MREDPHTVYALWDDLGGYLEAEDDNGSELYGTLVSRDTREELEVKLARIEEDCKRSGAPWNYRIVKLTPEIVHG